MGLCTDSAGNSTCSFHYSGLPCPLESSNKGLKDSSTVAFDVNYLASLHRTDQPAPLFIRQVPPDCPFLALPGEIRNHIYRCTLVTARPFSVQLHWNQPPDAALLRVNKQIFEEASAIFYAENTFRFQEALFVGAPIIPHLKTLYRVSRSKMKMMKNFVLDIPVYGNKSDSRYHTDTLFNFQYLTDLLTCSHGVKMQVRLGYAWGQNARDLGPDEYDYVLATARIMRLRGVEVDVHIRTHPRFMDEWVDFLTQDFQDRWSLEAIFQLGSTPQTRRTFDAINRFSDRYQMPGLKEFYEEAWSTSSYIFKPRRIPSPGARAEITA